MSGPAHVFTQFLPDGVELRMDGSMSYAEWLRVIIRRG